MNFLKKLFGNTEEKNKFPMYVKRQNHTQGEVDVKNDDISSMVEDMQDFANFFFEEHIISGFREFGNGTYKFAITDRFNYTFDNNHVLNCIILDSGQKAYVYKYVIEEYPNVLKHIKLTGDPRQKMLVEIID